ncbi:MAG TPA: hypothetical protein EYH48_00075 [Aquifex aeolicus]|uniref:Uncharacterized protein n=1 Tax=Aquifex aeolicus TaxID=63363 RepID=A0A9D0YNY9_AQUAO|nr:hypothetical protein [Aquificales bacterium]HIP86758.1 hypothetical protein [Aquifex sp.]HIP98460.1 hypothetical protein [Aquifex aeolicus]HIQ25722.1 hypothetical protein [Aquifex aeolicus]
MGKLEKLTLAFLLFFLAGTIYGVRLAENLRGYELSREIAKALIHILEFADKNFPNEEYIDIGFSIWGNRDILYISRFDNEITSEKNFTYTKEGYTIKCSVTRKGEYYLVTCSAE